MWRKCRGIYEVTETYGKERGEPNKSPWPWEAAGQHMVWLAIQAAGQCPSRLPSICCCLPQTSPRRTTIMLHPETMSSVSLTCSGIVMVCVSPFG